MRFIVTSALCLGLVLPLTAEAQTRLPAQSRSERQVEGINGNIRQERRLQGVEQQIQMDQNQFRQDIDRNRMFSNPPVGSRYLCPPGGIRC